MDKKITIIIPVYNGEKYIKRCIDSILKQTYKNIEIILIDDGSKDNTANIVKKSYYDKVNYYYKTNSGVSDSRNYGIHKTTGDIIFFMDVDDYFCNENYIEKALMYMDENNVKILKTAFLYEDKKREKHQQEIYNLKDGVYDSEYVKKISCFTNIFNSVWACFFDREVIKDSKVLFNTNLFYEEDYEFFIKTISLVENIGCFNFFGYCYAYNEKSVTKKINFENNLKKLKSIFKAHYNLIEFFEDDNYLINKSLDKISDHLLILFKENIHVKYKDFKTLLKNIDNIQEYIELKKYYKKSIYKFFKKRFIIHNLIVKKKYLLLYILCEIFLETRSEMKKIAILTINDDNNYGNRLQNYAVQENFKKIGVKVETIHNKENEIGIKVLIKKIKSLIKTVLPFKKFGRIKCFNKFNKNIKFSKYYIDKNHIPNNISNEYDAFFVGSDQVWNYNFKRMSDIDFLTFADNHKKNSFSASFGISDIPVTLKEYYKENLNSFNNISVREERGKVIIQELTGRKDVEVLVDPTMLLTAEEWDKVSKKPKQLKGKKYILNYFLGNLSEERKKQIEKIAKENDCDIINILDKNSPFYQTGPSEFLYLEKKAFLICTDSFHACVFAILYNKPFIVFDREDSNASMNSRIETLLKKFNLGNRKYSGKLEEKDLKCDYREAYEILEKEKEKAQNFIVKALN